MSRMKKDGFIKAWNKPRCPVIRSNEAKKRMDELRKALAGCDIQEEEEDDDEETKAGSDSEEGGDSEATAGEIIWEVLISWRV
jgi:hypothetical protein